LLIFLIPFSAAKRRWSWAWPTIRSIAYGCASAFQQLGADLAITYLNDKSRAYVEPLAQQLDASLFHAAGCRAAGAAGGGVRAD
jgi:hypothetical protein